MIPFSEEEGFFVRFKPSRFLNDNCSENLTQTFRQQIAFYYF